MSRCWKATLRLPLSTFPARPLPSELQRHLVQCTDDLYQWQTTHRPQRNPFVLHDGPPFANGKLHIGHALNKVLKDMILRAQIQNGRRVMYRPGWDCHGLPLEMRALGGDPTKNRPPKKLRPGARRIARDTMQRHIVSFRASGIMADWDNTWSTMDPQFELRQLRLFQKMARHGLIYRKHKPVYWSVSARTALAEAEIEYKDDHVSRAAYVRIPITSDCSSLPGLADWRGPLYAAIWTSTPWTLPANKAIAVHNDLMYSVLSVTGGYGLLVASSRVEAMAEYLPRFEVAVQGISGAQLTGLMYRNKLRGKREPDQPIVHADFVSADSGTGMVHLAPGHGQEDYEVCSRLGIEAFAPINDQGFFTDEAYPDWPEMLTEAPSVLDGGAEAVLDLLEEDVLGTHRLQHKYPYDWRTKRPVIVRATAQWFADVGSIKESCLGALRNVRFVPESGRARLESFVRGRNEWCISRQRVWGVPIPVLYDAKGNAVMTDKVIEHIISVMSERTSDAWFTDNPNDKAWVPPGLWGVYRRGMDTMDVWFDSGSSWTEVDHPVDVYLEGSDQHRGWFQSSLLTYVAAQKADGKADDEVAAPFGTLITHGFILDSMGKKMSKSEGGGIFPKDVATGRLLPPIKGGEEYDELGPDALRLWAASSDFTSDTPIGPAILQPVHNALIKYRTILKMILGSLHDSGRNALLTKLDQIAIVQLCDTMRQVREAVDNYEFHKACGLINRWVATDLSAFYLEALKDRLYCGDGGGALETILIGFLRMLAPITPILVEEAWSHRPMWMLEYSMQHPARQLYDDPVIDSSRLTADQDKLRRDVPTLKAVHDAVKAGLEQAREAKALGSSLQSSVIITTDDSQVAAVLADYLDELNTIFVVSHVALNEGLPEGPPWCYTQQLELDGEAKGTVHVLPPRQEKCSRCWRYMAEKEGGLCGRCEDSVGTTDAGEPAA